MARAGDPGSHPLCPRSDEEPGGRGRKAEAPLPVTGKRGHGATRINNNIPPPHFHETLSI